MSTAVNEQEAREHAEPSEADGALSPIVLVVVGALAYFSLTYALSATNDDPYGYGGDHRSVYTPAAAPLDGEGLFGQHCSACHQSSGQGVPGSFPPLAGSSWVVQDPQTPTRVLLRGLQGPIEVGGNAFAGEMPNFGNKLKDEEIAKIVTYIRTSWGNEASEVTPEDVAAVRDSLADAPARPWNGGAELEAARSP